MSQIISRPSGSKAMPVRTSEHRLHGGATVAGEPWLARAGDGGGDAGSRDGGAAVAGVAPLAVSGDGRGRSRLAVQPSDALVVQIAEVQRAVGTDDHTVGIGDLSVGKSRVAGADNRGDGRPLRFGEADQQQKSRCETECAFHDVFLTVDIVAWPCRDRDA